MRLIYAFAFAIALIAIATLLPANPQNVPLSACLICGDRGVADAILNILLFLPLGAVLAARGWRLRSVLAAGFAISLLVEMLQLAMPGRDPSAGDLLFNTGGALAGVWIERVLRAWRSVSHDAAPRFALLAATAALLVVAAGALLLTPAFPQRQYYGQWTPEFADMEAYDGRVTRVRVGSTPIFNDRVRRSAAVRSSLLGGDLLQVDVVAGTPPNRAAPVFNIYDDLQREVIFIGAERADLLIRYRMVATTLKLDQPTLRFADALRDVPQGGSWKLQLRRAHGGLCVEVQDTHACPAGFTAARGWAVLMHTGMPPWLEQLLDLFWVWLLFVPAGTFILRRRTAVLIVPFSILGMLFVSGNVDLLPMRASALVAGVVGLLAGALARRRFLA